MSLTAYKLSSTDPWSHHLWLALERVFMECDLGSSVKLWELTHYSTGRDPYLDGPVGLQTERLACTA